MMNIVTYDCISPQTEFYVTRKETSHFHFLSLFKGGQMLKKKRISSPRNIVFRYGQTLGFKARRS